MSDQELQELRRRYAETGATEDHTKLFVERARLGEAATALDLELRAAVAADLHDLRALERYGAWLTATDDGRARAVERLLEVRRGAERPILAGGSKDWQSTLGIPLWKAINAWAEEAEGLEPERRELAIQSLLTAAAPAIAITTFPVDGELEFDDDDDDGEQEEDAVGASRFGGLPDLAQGSAWPSCSMGPLGFLGQIALKDLSGMVAARELPDDGLLSIFGYQDWESGHQPGMEDDADDVRVLYTPGDAQLVRLEAPAELNEANAVLPVCGLGFEEFLDLPAVDSDSKNTAHEKFPQPLADAIAPLGKIDWDFDLPDVHPGGHHLFGYSRHARTDEPCPGPTWRHLVCLDSDDHLGWSWCDGEHLAIFVQGEDLADRSLKRIYGYAS